MSRVFSTMAMSLDGYITGLKTTPRTRAGSTVCA